jgi:hypothetical protein
MTWARRALGPIAAVWLVCQAASLALVPTLEAGWADCTCAHGADATCPMHHKTASGLKVCVMRSAAASVPAILNSLLSVAGLLPAPPLAVVQVVRASAVAVVRSPLTERPSPPDSPPPRA